uniref:Uncharacterized protein n=1 Tax=Xiphophorus couchianus TaxID=32473 RepID=A0A3B5MQD4_9TELE
MEERADSPVPVKVEENPDSVVLMYFKGDINSMVDEHFSRALGKANKAYESGLRSKKIRKTVKLARWDPASPPAPSRTHFQAGRCLRGTGSLWTLQQASNLVSLNLILTFIF